MSNFSNSVSTHITSGDLLQLQEECLNRLKDGQLYHLRNEAKLRAVYNTQSYDEFKDIVDAAHLTAISKTDKMNPKTKNRLWNSVSREE